MIDFLNKVRRGLGLLSGQHEGDPRFDASVAALTLAGTTARPAQVAKRAAALFAPLGRSRPGFDWQAADYVATGGASSILSTAANIAVQAAWRSANNVWPRRDQHGVFAPGVDWTSDQVMRLGEVVAALEPIQFDWGFFGTSKSPDWMRHAASLWLGHDRKGMSLDWLLSVAEAGGLGIGAVLDVLLSRGAGSYGDRNSVDRFADPGAWLVAHRETVVAALPALGADERAEFAATVGRFGVAPVFLSSLIDLAIGSSKKARSNARQALTGTDPDSLCAELAVRFTKLPPAGRAELLEVAALLGAAAEPLLAGWAAGETAPRVLAAIERARGTEAAAVDEVVPDDATGYLAIDGTWVAIPPQPPLPVSTRIPAETLALLDPAAAAFNVKLFAGQDEAERGRWHWSRQFAPVGAAQISALRKLGEGSHNLSTRQETALGWIRHLGTAHPGVAAFFDDPGVTLYHLVRYAVASTNGYFFAIFGDWSGPVGSALARRLAPSTEGAVDIRTLLALWVQHGGRDPVAEHLGSPWYTPLAEQDVPLWLALADRLELIDEALGMRPQSGARTLTPRPALTLLALFPKVPRRYHLALMTLASGANATLRDLARRLLRNAPGIEDAIEGLLADGRQEIRAGAAQWLTVRDARDRVSALRRALAKERSELARAAIITALERLGDDVGDLFDNAALLKEAQAGLAKTRPKDLDWFPVEQLPALHWRDGAAIDARVLRWWVVLAAKLKQPGGNALFDLWLDRLAPGDAHRLGSLVLTSWIEQDTRTCTVDEANAHAAAHVDAALQQHQSLVRQYPQSAGYWSTDRDTVFAQLRRMKLGAYLGSAADSKGVLALATRIDGADAARRVQPFLKDHGARTAQAKALLDCLAANPSPAALQVVLAAANRAKQRSVQAHAATLVEAVAERRGWTAEELADRTVPTGGLDRDGTLDLDLGRDRTYQLRLGADDALLLLNAEGKEVKALPGPRIENEKPLIESVKKQVATARKEVKQVFAAQTDRLREAMLLGRRWQREDWESFVAAHPLAGRLAARLVWLGLHGDRRAAFRPLGDGTYSDAADEEVDVALFADVQLAHSSLIDADAIAAWQRHLKDYEVKPPFDQLGRALRVLDPGEAKARAVTDREGWMIETFQLRGIAGKLGYARGQAGDGGWFTSYERPYRGAGIVAEIEFSGSPLPEENTPAALHGLSFRQLRGTGWSGRQLALEEVPPVLLAESRQDYHDIAAKGSGFDPDWQKKT